MSTMVLLLLVLPTGALAARGGPEQALEPVASLEVTPWRELGFGLRVFPSKSRQSSQNK